MNTTCVSFVSRAASEQGLEVSLGKRISSVSNCRSVSKNDMLFNDATPLIEIDPETYLVKADGQELTCEPLEVVPMAQRYFLF